LEPVGKVTFDQTLNFTDFRFEMIYEASPDFNGKFGFRAVRTEQQSTSYWPKPRLCGCPLGNTGNQTIDCAKNSRTPRIPGHVLTLRCIKRETGINAYVRADLL
jgi:hypothetical protein